jgi:hypothetical protein
MSDLSCLSLFHALHSCDGDCQPNCVKKENVSSAIDLVRTVWGELRGKVALREQFDTEEGLQLYKDTLLKLWVLEDLETCPYHFRLTTRITGITESARAIARQVVESHRKFGMFVD